MEFKIIYIFHNSFQLFIHQSVSLARDATTSKTGKVILWPFVGNSRSPPDLSRHLCNRAFDVGPESEMPHHTR